MRFPYQTHIVGTSDDGSELLLSRPELDLKLIGPKGSAVFIGLVDTGADQTILPTFIAHRLGIELGPHEGPIATAFGGQRLDLLDGAAVLEIRSGGEILAWTAPLCFFDYSEEDESTVVLGYVGFLEFFTATFDGDALELTLEPNRYLPRVHAQ